MLNNKTNILIKTEKEISYMREAGSIIAEIMNKMEKAIEPGITTLELDNISKNEIKKNKVKSAFLGMYDFPNTICVSINEEIVHGIPSSRKLKNGGIIGLTNDQLLREGILVPFFGKKTPTPQAAAIMSIKFNVPIYMVRVERLKGVRFLMTIEKKLDVVRSKNNDQNVYNITKKISDRIEDWIIERPEQWLWSHRRWGK